MRNRFLFGIMLCSLVLCHSCRQDRYVAFSGYAQGGVYTVKINLKGVRVPLQQIREHVDSLLEQVDYSLSGYNKASLLSRMNAGERVRPDSLLLRIYEESYRYWERSMGAFDIAAGPLFDAWGFGFKSGEMPSAERVGALRSACGTSRLHPSMAECLGPDGTLSASDLLLPATALAGNSASSCTAGPVSALPAAGSSAPAAALAGTSGSGSAPAAGSSSARAAGSASASSVGSGSVPARTAGSPAGSASSSSAPAGPVPPVLNFNAIAQGFTSDLIAGYLKSIGVKDMLVDIGEIYCSGLNPKGRGWSVGIDAPIDGNDNPGANIEGVWNSEGASVGIVTSGNYRKFYIRDGRKYAHTIDPRTGYPVEHGLLSATIVASSATEADAMATACMVLGPQKAMELILESGNLEGCLIFAGDSLWTSPGFRLTTSH